MADDKKGGAPKAAPSSGWDPIEIALILLIASAFLGFLSSIISSLFRGSTVLTFYGIPVSVVTGFFTNNGLFFKALLLLISAFMVAGTVIFLYRKNKIIDREKAKLFPHGEPGISGNIVIEDNIYKERWRKILEFSNGDIESNWRLSIIEADIMLDELLDKINLPGDTIGDKLKGVEKSDFNTIDLAWEAHKVRNMIAHQGSNFKLNQRETRLVISLYEQVFKEFFLI